MSYVPLTLEEQPGFAEIPEAELAGGLPLTSGVLKMLNSAVKFAAVRTEYFYGYYGDGETVVLPESPVDGYQYAREELRYIWSVYWTGSPVGQLAGTLFPPLTGATSGEGQVLQMGFSVDQPTGLVHTVVSYYQDGKQQQDTADGILLVHTIAKRAR